MTEDQFAEAMAGHRRRNAELKDTLSENGVDLLHRRPIDVHFWAWSQRDAAILGRELYRKGFLVKTIARSRIAGDEESWSVEAGALIVPEEILGEEFTDDMVRLAARCEAVYDGWGTEV